nr:hypothetical protein [Vibrio mexicanus]
MDFLLYLAAFLLVLVSIAHSYLGERFLLSKLFEQRHWPKVLGSDGFAKRTLRFAWHLTSVTCLGFAAILVVLTQPQVSKLLISQIIATTFAFHFVISLLASRGKHLSWILFGTVTFLVVLNTYL